MNRLVRRFAAALSRPLVLAALASGPTALAAPPLSDPSTAPAPADRAAWEHAAVAALGPDAVLGWDDFRGVPKALRRLDVPTIGLDPTSRALGFVSAHRALLGLPPAVGVTPLGRTAHRDGVAVQLGLTLDGLEVAGRAVTVSLDLRGHVRAVHLDAAPTGLAATSRDLGPAAAAAAVRGHFRVLATGRATRVAYPTAAGPARPAWRLPVVQLPYVAHFLVWVDAETGAILAQAPAAHDQPVRRLEVAR